MINAIEQLGHALAAEQIAEYRGTPEAIADCRRRVKEAQLIAIREVSRVPNTEGKDFYQDSIEGERS